MSWQGLYSLESRVERLAAMVESLQAQNAALAQQLAQVASRSGQGSGSSGLVRLWLPSGISGGLFGTASTVNDAIVSSVTVAGYDSTGGPTTTVYNSDTTSISSGKAAWGQPRSGGGYDLVVGDC